MFKNFDKVFRFSFHNIVSVTSFKVVTVLIAALILVIPSILMVLIFSKTDNEDGVKSCEANTIYIVDEVGNASEEKMQQLNELGEKNYSGIKYIVSDTVDDALGTANAELSELPIEVAEKMEGTKNLVIHFSSENENEIVADIIIPANSVIKEKEAKRYYEFMDAHQKEFKKLLTDMSDEAYKKLSVTSEFKTYTEKGYKEGYTIDEDIEGAEKKSSEGVLKVLQMAFPYFIVMFMYFMILVYGQDISRTMVMEKESKLMDTMLVSLHPEAMVFGKLLAGVAAGLFQLGIWIVSIVLGVFAGIGVSKLCGFESENPISLFMRNARELGAFKPSGIILAIIILIVGFVLYSSLAAIAGALAANTEELSSQTVIFILPLVFSLMAYIYGGGIGGNIASWLYYIPFTATLVAPGAVALGMMPIWQAIVSLVIMIAVVMGLVIFAGRLYKMTSLYKGNALKLGAAIKMMTGK